MEAGTRTALVTILLKGMKRAMGVWIQLIGM